MPVPVSPRGGLGSLGQHRNDPLQARAHIDHLDLGHGHLVAVVGRMPQLSGDDDPVTTVDALGHVLGQVGCESLTGPAVCFSGRTDHQLV